MKKLRRSRVNTAQVMVDCEPAEQMNGAAERKVVKGRKVASSNHRDDQVRKMSQ